MNDKITCEDCRKEYPTTEYDPDEGPFCGDCVKAFKDDDGKATNHIETLKKRIVRLGEGEKVSLGIVFGHMRNSQDIALEGICGAIQMGGGQEAADSAHHFYCMIASLYRRHFIKADVMPNSSLIRVNLADGVEAAMRQLGLLTVDKK